MSGCVQGAGNPVHLGAMNTAVFSRKKLGTPKGGGSGLVLPFSLDFLRIGHIISLLKTTVYMRGRAQILPTITSVILTINSSQWFELQNILLKSVLCSKLLIETSGGYSINKGYLVE